MKYIYLVLVFLIFIVSSCKEEQEEINLSLIPGNYNGRMSYWDGTGNEYPFVSIDSLCKRDGYEIKIDTLEDHLVFDFDDNHNFTIPDLEFEISNIDYTNSWIYFSLSNNENYFLYKMLPPGYLNNGFSIDDYIKSISFNLSLESKDTINHHRINIRAWRGID